MRPNLAPATSLLLVTATLLGSPAAAPSWAESRAAVVAPYTSASRTPVAPGVVHDAGTFETDTAGTQAAYLIEIDLDAPEISVEASLSNDRVAGLETTTSQASRQSAEGHRAVAGINADFWASREEPQGLHIQDGELMVAGPAERPTLGFEADGDVRIGSPRVTGELTLPDSTTVAVSRVNQARPGTGLVVYTPRFGASTRTDATGTEVVLDGATLPLTATAATTATVSAVRAGAGDTPIGSAELVLSASGPTAATLAALTPGASVTLSFAITAGWEATSEAVSGGQYIVQEGAVNVAPHDPGFADVTHPRSAVGLTADGDLVMAVVDGRQPGYSTGVRLDELGELMRDRGAVTAINLDGGGSSTLVARLPGDDAVSQLNRGSDGFERSVSNSLLVFSSAPTGPLAIVNVVPPQASLLVGGGLDYVARGQDAAYNPVAIDPAAVSWSVEGGIGSIDAAGRFSSTAAGSGSVVAEVNGITGRAEVRTVDALATLAVGPDPAIVEPGSTQAFTLAGTDASGAPVLVEPSQASWSVEGAIGTIDADGVLTASTETASGAVVATAGSATGRARVDIGRPPAVLEDFEDISDMRALAARGTATLTSAMRPDPVRFGTRSARLGWDFTTGPAGTSAAYAAHSPTLSIDARPRAIGVWVYGDGSRHWVRGNYRDGNNAQKVINLTPPPSPAPVSADDCRQRAGGIDWIGWKYLEAPIPADAVLPLRWERVYVVETSDLCDDVSAIYLDDLRAVYSDTGEDLVGPSVSDLLPAPNGTVYTATPEIGGTVIDNAGGSGVAPDSIRLILDDAQAPATFDPATGAVRFTPASPLADGEHAVRLEATDLAGNPALPFGDWTFTVYTGPDVEAPIVDRAQPLDGITSPIGRPRVSARLRDPYTGIDPDSIHLLVDGERVDATWDEAAGVVWWQPGAPLSDGVHSVELSVADLETPANVTALAWDFSVAALPQPAAGETARLTWIADGGYFEGPTETSAATEILAEHLAREAADPPDLLVFGGDLVENDQQVNYDRAVAALDAVGAPRLVAAGNHEISGSLSRDRFWRTFGPTIGVADFGAADLVVLDSANSSLGYDASQFGWLEQTLATSDAATVLVVLHVPTRDPFASGHGLPASEGERLEAILAAAAADRPEREIIVLSGDAHAYARWERDGVTYLISGGGGGGPDATPEEGGFYHRLAIEIAADGTPTISVVPLVETITTDPAELDLLGGETAAPTATADLFTASAANISMTVGEPFARSWVAGDPAVVAIDPLSGALEALVPGETTVTITSGGVSAVIAVRVTATLESLTALTERAAREGGIRHEGIATALLAKLAEAADGDPEALASYLDLLHAQRGKKIDAAWADRLIANAEYVAAVLGP